MDGRNNEKGAAIVEFAIILPFLLFLVGGIIQFGFIFNGQITLTSAVREAARLAVVNNDADIKQKVIDSSTALMLKVDKNNIAIVIDGEEKTVSAEGTVDIFMPFLGFLADKGKSYKTLTASSTMRDETF